MAHPRVYHYPFAHEVIESDNQRLPVQPYAGATVLYGRDFGEKIAAVDQQSLLFAIKKFDRVIIEADGARRAPLKIHAERDPVISDQATLVIAVVGLSALGRSLDERVMYLHDRYRLLTGDSSTRVSPMVYQKLLEHPEGLLKGCGERDVVVCCNQSDAISNSEMKQIIDTVTSTSVKRPFTLMVGSWHQDRLEYMQKISGLPEVKE
jgi:probable selenium-dependent hydroxylase accessory protein YqeC